MTQLPDDLRRTVEPFTRLIAEYFHEHAAWPPATLVTRKLGRVLGRDADARVAVRDVPNDYGHSGYGSGDEAVATVRAFATFAPDLVDDDLRLFVRTVNRLVELDDAAPDEAAGIVTQGELELIANTPEEIAKLKLLLRLEGLIAGGGSSPDMWTYEIADLARRIGPIDSVDEYLLRRGVALSPRSNLTLPTPTVDMGAVATTLARTAELMATVSQPPITVANVITPAMLRQMQPSFEVARRLAADIERMVGPLSRVYAQAARIAEMTPRLDLFENVLGASAAVNLVLASERSMIAPAFNADLALIAKAIASSTSALGNVLASLPLHGAGLQAVALGWRTFVEGDLRPGHSTSPSEILVVGGRGVLGVNLAAGIEAGVELDIQEELVSWDEMPLTTRERLLDRLGDLNAALPQKLSGAWERVTRGGPDAGSQAANSLIELIDWTLRDATVGIDLIGWHAREQRPPGEIDDNGRPTRALKIGYLCRAEPSGEQLVRGFTKIITETLTSLQGLKHREKIVEPEVVLRLIPTVEAVLTFLLVR